MNSMREIQLKGLRRSLRRSLPTLILIAIFLCFVGAWYTLQFHTEATVTAKILNLTERRDVSGDNDHISTSYTYIVSTDKGLFKIQPDGLMASPAFGTLEKGKTYTMKVRGMTNEFLGMYPYIVSAEEIEER